jgi:hypothetical protein
MPDLDAIPRDRWQRPLITPPGETEPVPYIRASTIAGVLDDKTGIHKWEKRNVARGLLARPDLLALVGAYVDDDKATNRVLDDAANAGGSGRAANYGTAVHAFTDTIDAGGTPWGVPADRVADLDAYTRAMAAWEVVAGERFVVCDELRVAGTFDKLARHRTSPVWGGLHMGDVKTGKDADHPLKVCIQLAVYAHSDYYDPETEERTPTGADLVSGLLIVVRENTCTIYAADLEIGWEAAQLAVGAHRARALKPADLITKLDEVHIEPAPDVDPFADIALANDVDDLRAAYTALVGEGYGPAEVLARCKARGQEIGVKL